MSNVVRAPKAEGEYRAQVKFFEQCYLTMYRNGLNMTEEMMDVAHYAKFAESKNRITHNHITISFPKEFKHFDIMEKVVKKKWMFEWMYTWEFTDSDGNFSHPHVHLVCRKTKPKSQIIREIASTTKLDANYIDVQEYKKSEYDPSYIFKNRESDVAIRRQHYLKDKYTYEDGLHNGMDERTNEEREHLDSNLFLSKELEKYNQKMEKIKSKKDDKNGL